MSVPVPEGGEGVPAGTYSRFAVPVTTGVCLLALTVVLKNILVVPAEQLNRDIVLYIILFGGFMVSYSTVSRISQKPGSGNPLLWCILIITATLGVITVYAI